MRPLKTTKLFMVLILVITCLSSCTHYYYAPNAHNVTLFKEKGDNKFSVAQCIGDEMEGVDVQGAVALSNKMAIMMNAFFVHSPKDEIEYGSGKGKLIEVGVGYFKPFASNELVFETYGGLGWGSVENQYDNGGELNAKLMRYFIQPAIGYTSPYFELAFSTRVAALVYGRNEKNGLMGEFNLNYTNQHKWYFLVEPALTIRAGSKYLKLQSQVVLSYNQTQKSLPQEKFNFNTGLYLTIPVTKINY